MSGWITPFSRIEAARSSISFSANSRRGWFGFGRMRSIGMAWLGAGGASAARASTGATSASRADRPRPRPFFSICMSLTSASYAWTMSRVACMRASTSPASRW